MGHHEFGQETFDPTKGGEEDRTGGGYVAGGESGRIPEQGTGSWRLEGWER